MENNKNDLNDLNEELDQSFDELENDLDELGITELMDQDGNLLKFFMVGNTEYNGKNYLFFMPAEEIDGLGEGEVVIFEEGTAVVEGRSELLPVEDASLLEIVYEKFCNEMDELANSLEAEELECGCGHHHHHHHDCDCGCEDDCDCDDCDCDCDDDCDCDCDDCE